MGSNTAIISLGLSCQTAWNINECAEQLSEIVGEELSKVRLPLDWLIAPIDSAAAWLAEPSAFPAAEDDLQPQPSLSKTALLWPAMRLFFWHDFKTSAGLDVSSTLYQTKLAYSRGFRRLLSLQNKNRIVFVVSNTQNSLLPIREEHPNIDFSFGVRQLIDLKSAAEAAISCVGEMLVVTNSEYDCIDKNKLISKNIKVAKIEKDNSKWKGDITEWRRAFEMLR